MGSATRLRRVEHQEILAACSTLLDVRIRLGDLGADGSVLDAVADVVATIRALEADRDRHLEVRLALADQTRWMREEHGW